MAETRSAALASPLRLLAISPGDAAEREGEAVAGWVAGWVDDLGAAGVDAVQLREKVLADRDLWALCRRTVAAAGGRLLVLVNGRADIACATGLAGVHLTSHGLPVTALRRRFGPGLVLGRSTHRLAEVEAARRDGADYVTFGPVYETPSKTRYGPPLGLAALTRACTVGIPVLALGGVTRERLPELAAAGAAGVAGIRLFADPASLPELVRCGRELFGAGDDFTT